MSSRIALPLVLLVGCARDEGLTITDLHGEVIIPEAAATRLLERPDGSTETVTDVRLIGPVYLGLFASVRTGVLPYPHPEFGPVFQPDFPGDTFPYGGTSIGDLRFPCLKSLVCKVPSGRYVDFDSMVSWFNDTLQMPILDVNGDTVQTGDYIAEVCFEQLSYTDAAEIRLTASEDRNGDGTIDETDLDFVRQSDGTFRAEFTIWQQEYFSNAETGTGFSLWGWMDSPSPTNNQFTTCDPNDGFQIDEYSVEFNAGRPKNDLLNHPSFYIGGGDWVSSQAFVYGSPDDFASVTMDFEVEQ